MRSPHRHLASYGLLSHHPAHLRLCAPPWPWRSPPIKRAQIATPNALRPTGWITTEKNGADTLQLFVEEDEAPAGAAAPEASPPAADSAPASAAPVDVSDAAAAPATEAPPPTPPAKAAAAPAAASPVRRGSVDRNPSAAKTAKASAPLAKQGTATKLQPAGAGKS